MRDARDEMHSVLKRQFRRELAQAAFIGPPANQEKGKLSVASVPEQRHRFEGEIKLLSQ